MTCPLQSRITSKGGSLSSDAAGDAIMPTVCISVAFCSSLLGVRYGAMVWMMKDAACALAFAHPHAMFAASWEVSDFSRRD